MQLSETKLECQIPCLRKLSPFPGKMPPASLPKRFKMWIRRHLNPGRERAFKKATNNYLNQFYTTLGMTNKCAPKEKNIPSKDLKPGDWVRIRPLHEIQGTVNHWNQVKGCAFMPVMAKYCGVTARVFNVMRRFVDECDLLVKASNGIILLEGITCEGTEDLGRCDRNCFHFWREEWLERIEPPVVDEFESEEKKPAETGAVQVRSASEIMESINKGGDIDHSLFKPQMLKFCGTTQRILKPMQRYTDEHDLTIKTVEGVVILENVICRGGSEDVKCDRACHYLWKEEWLESLSSADP